MCVLPFISCRVQNLYFLHVTGGHPQTKTRWLSHAQLCAKSGVYISCAHDDKSPDCVQTPAVLLRICVCVYRIESRTFGMAVTSASGFQSLFLSLYRFLAPSLCELNIAGVSHSFFPARSACDAFISRVQCTRTKDNILRSTVVNK